MYKLVANQKNLNLERLLVRSAFLVAVRETPSFIED
jgi:hypothetical protein